MQLMYNIVIDFVPGRPGTEEFVPGQPLLSLSRDKGTAGRPVPVCPGTSRGNTTTHHPRFSDLPPSLATYTTSRS